MVLYYLTEYLTCSSLIFKHRLKALYVHICSINHLFFSFCFQISFFLSCPCLCAYTCVIDFDTLTYFSELTCTYGPHTARTPLSSGRQTNKRTSTRSARRRSSVSDWKVSCPRISGTRRDKSVPRGCRHQPPCLFVHALWWRSRSRPDPCFPWLTCTGCSAARIKLSPKPREELIMGAAPAVLRQQQPTGCLQSSPAMAAIESCFLHRHRIRTRGRSCFWDTHVSSTEHIVYHDLLLFTWCHRWKVFVDLCWAQVRKWKFWLLS